MVRHCIRRVEGALAIAIMPASLKSQHYGVQDRSPVLERRTDCIVF